MRGVPCDTLHVGLTLNDEAVKLAPHSQDIHAADEAALCSLTISGALGQLLTQTVTYAGERSQFGKPLARFQVIQQYLAVLAGHACAAAAAADMAARALVQGGDILPIAIAKSRAGEAAGLACNLAHQIHGAIGITSEHRLHFITQLLWSCRDAGGAEAYWNARIGLRVAQVGPDALWPLLASM
jgi:acyl-CoA dehydrogenase